MRKIILTADSTRHSKTKKKEWVFLFSQMAELCPPENPYFSEEQEKIQSILRIVSAMSAKELNAFADSLRCNSEYQEMYHSEWLHSPEDYNRKTQILIDHIFEDLELFRIEKSLRKRGAKSVC